MERGKEVDPAEHEAADNRRKTAEGGDRSGEATDTIEAERARKYQQTCAERDAVLETIRQIDQRNAAADLFFKVNANIYIEEAKSIGTNLQVELFESVLDEEGDVKNMVMYMVAQKSETSLWKSNGGRAEWTQQADPYAS